MANEVAATDGATATRGLVSRLGFWSAVLTALFAAVSLAIGVTTPPRSGPFAPAGSGLAYPFADAARFVPARIHLDISGSADDAGIPSARSLRARTCAGEPAPLRQDRVVSGDVLVRGPRRRLLRPVAGGPAGARGGRRRGPRARVPVQPTRGVHRAREPGIPGRSHCVPLPRALARILRLERATKWGLWWRSRLGWPRSSVGGRT